MNTDVPKKKETIRISKKDLRQLLNDNAHYQQQITELQTRNTELLLENRELKKQATVLPESILIPYEPPAQPAPMHPDLGPEIYFDNAYGLDMYGK
jgi:cytochrome c-type biogenesis protein CcmH/NrfG